MSREKIKILPTKAEVVEHLPKFQEEYGDGKIVQKESGYYKALLQKEEALNRTLVFYLLDEENNIEFSCYFQPIYPENNVYVLRGMTSKIKYIRAFREYKAILKQNEDITIITTSSERIGKLVLLLQGFKKTTLKELQEIFGDTFVEEYTRGNISKFYSNPQEVQRHYAKNKIFFIRERKEK